ncbi:MAG TPA: mannose-1-phosphate guanylyltransferase [Prevotella sp.]|nr:mannose-1-phosphate guanylyltransferase [Prevotella sp.]
MNNHLVIMAGGVGSRFWPMSTAERPKQFIDALGVGRSLIQLTFDRFEGICDPNNVWVVTNKRYFDLVHEQLPEVPVSNILMEPCRRNTAPCIAYVSWSIFAKDPNANIVVTPSDAVVMVPNEFRRVINNCLNFVSNIDSIVTLGMLPTRPETGYGYIQADLSANEDKSKEIFRVEAFKEKPDLQTAEKYIHDYNNFYWNAGIFLFNVSTIINAFHKFTPGIAQIFDSMKNIYGTKEEQEVIDAKYPECEDISIDYAIMEKSHDIYVCPASFGWSDLGTWGSLLTQSRRDITGNAAIGKNISMYDSSNCIVHTNTLKKVVIQGLNQYIIAEEAGQLLICKLSEEQRIKQFSGTDKK